MDLIEMELNEMEWNWMKWNGIKGNEMELNEMTWNWMKWNGIVWYWMTIVKRNDCILRDRMIWFEIESNGVRLGKTEYGGSEMKWNGWD